MIYALFLDIRYNQSSGSVYFPFFYRGSLYLPAPLWDSFYQDEIEGPESPISGVHVRLLQVKGRSRGYALNSERVD